MCIAAKIRFARFVDFKDSNHVVTKNIEENSAALNWTVLLVQRTLTVGARITVQLVSSLTRLDLTKEENMLFFVCSETAKSKLVKLRYFPQRWVFSGLCHNQRVFLPRDFLPDNFIIFWSFSWRVCPQFQFLFKLGHFRPLFSLFSSFEFSFPGLFSLCLPFQNWK